MTEETTGEDTAADLPVHVVLGGKYELVDVLGTGATFTVYEAQRVAAPAVAEPAGGEGGDQDAADADTGTVAAGVSADAADATRSEAEPDGAPRAEASDDATVTDAEAKTDAETGSGADADATAEIAEPVDPDQFETDLDQPLVVKVLHPHLVDDQNARDSLRREVDASALVNHPGVVKVLDSGEEDVAGANVPWTVMNRMAGVSLSDFAGDSGLHWRDALAIIDGLLEALSAVHAAGLVHRDVAPRNVMVDKQADGTFVVGLLDLGLTRPAGGDGDGATVAGSVIGMSPEQARGKPLDARSDIYSVGALAYYTLTGHAPYERAQAEDVLRAHVNAPVPAASARRASVPASVDRLVSRAMAKDPGRRFPTAEAMRATVTILLGGPAGLLGTSGETMQLGVGAGGTEVLDPAAGATGSGTMRLGHVPGDHDRTTTVAAIGATAVGAAGAAATAPAPVAVAVPPPVEPLEERRWWHTFTRGRGRVATVAVFALLVLGGAGLVVANLLDDQGSQVVTPSVSPSAREPSRSPSSTPSDTEDEEVAPPPPVVRPNPTPPSTPSPEPTPTREPTPPPTTTPTDEPSDPPTDLPTDPPTDSPTDVATDPPTDPPPTEPVEPSPGPSGGEAGADPPVGPAGGL